MKTKTIYHLDQDCNIVRVESIVKGKKNKKRPIVNIERLIGELKITHPVQDETQSSHQFPFQKTPTERELLITQLRDKLFPASDNASKIQEIELRLHQLTKQVRSAAQRLERTDKANRRRCKSNLRLAAQGLSSAAHDLVSFVELALLNSRKR